MHTRSAAGERRAVATRRRVSVSVTRRRVATRLRGNRAVMRRPSGSGLAPRRAAAPEWRDREAPAACRAPSEAREAPAARALRVPARGDQRGSSRALRRGAPPLHPSWRVVPLTRRGLSGAQRTCGRRLRHRKHGLATHGPCHGEQQPQRSQERRARPRRAVTQSTRRRRQVTPGRIGSPHARRCDAYSACSARGRRARVWRRGTGASLLRARRCSTQLPRDSHAVPRAVPGPGGARGRRVRWRAHGAAWSRAFV